MAAYVKQTWVDHIVADDTGEVLQQGTILDAAHFNHMEEGIAAMSESLEDLSIGEEGATLQGVLSSIDEAIETKVEKEDGKGLSTNDFTTALKSKLEAQLSATEIQALLDRVLALEHWKTNVLSGTTPVLVDQTT